MKTALYNYCESELNHVAFVLNKHKNDPAYSWVNPYETITNAIQRCLGAATFAQEQGLSYQEAEDIHTFFSEKLRKMLDN